MIKNESINFFNQCNKTDSLALLKDCAQNQTKIFGVQENQVQAFVCKLRYQFLTQFYVHVEKKNLKLDQKYSFCFKVLGRIYFFKSHLSQDRKGICLSENIQVFELQRRKHTRFEIPDEWLQSCVIYSNIKKMEKTGLQPIFKIGANIINISWSGIRIKVGPSFSEFHLNTQIQFALRIHRRAEFLANGEIINIKKNKNTGTVLGIEFRKTSKLFDSKIQNVCDDLLRYSVLRQKNTP